MARLLGPLILCPTRSRHLSALFSCAFNPALGTTRTGGLREKVLETKASHQGPVGIDMGCSCLGCAVSISGLARQL